MLPVFTVAGHRLLARTCPHLTPAEVAAYDAPFPDATFKGGVRRFPNLMPGNPDAEGAAFHHRMKWQRVAISFRSGARKSRTQPSTRCSRSAC